MKKLAFVWHVMRRGAFCLIIKLLAVHTKPVHMAASAVVDERFSPSQREDKIVNNEDKKWQNGGSKQGACCCCVNLKIAVKVIAFFQIILNTLFFLFMTYADFSQMKVTIERNNDLMKNDSMSTIPISDDETEGFCGAQSMELEALIMTSIAVRLIIGLYKNKPNLVEAWYHSMTELICLSLFLFITRAAFIYFVSNRKTFVFIDVTEPIYHGIMCYFTWTVYKYYRSIKGKQMSGNCCFIT